MILKATSLGATMYMPALREDIVDAAKGRTVPGLRSLVICLEDAVNESDVPAALSQLRRTLQGLKMAGQRDTAVFIRPRNAEMLARLSQFRGIEVVDGYVLPKVTPNSFPVWMEALRTDGHKIMPTIETAEAFDQSEMRRLRDQMQAVADRVLAIRIGGNDLLSTLGARRSRHRTVHEGPLGTVIAMLAGTFIPYGFAMSSPVLEVVSDMDLLRREVEQDLEQGLLTKTAIHPAQVQVIQEMYRVDPDDYADATAILDEEARAVFKSHGAMCEPQTHRAWAAQIIERASIYGIRDDGIETLRVA